MEALRDKLYNFSLVLLHIPWTVIGIFSWKSLVINLLRVRKEDLKYLQEKQYELIKNLNSNQNISISARLTLTPPSNVLYISYSFIPST